ncbi:MAG: DNA gyrase subunit A [Limnochordia bacterium]|jgi:DNA gyrase subunit A|nr:DNA gyrase subunit A [Bacillota bacterium]
MALEMGKGKVVPIGLEDEMRKSYLTYAMSVIVERALPDVRDGLKPVQRRILYGMSELSLWPDRPHRKSARIVGEVMGKFHPHGDAAIYDAMVRMAQDFSIRYPLVDGHGNFGSVDGDPPAAMRYTEARLSALAMEMLRDIDKDTVDFVPNFDESLEQPAVLPSRFPNLLVNGASGIAVGMATNIPPHNLREIVDGLINLIDNPDITIKELNKVIKGPDFPTGGIILGKDGIREAYLTGRGRIRMRARAAIEELAHGKTRIVVTELPYQVNKANLIERIAAMVREKKLEGITDLRDESDRQGMRIVIELRRDAVPRVVLNRLYKHTQMEETFGVIMLALVDGEPMVLNLKEMLEAYLNHQREVVVRRTRFLLQKAEDRAHILEGLRIALAHIDEIIELIKAAPNDTAAKEGLMERFNLSERQAVAILDMQLRRLTGLEQEKIEAEYQSLLKDIAYYREVLADVSKVYGIIKEELLEIREKYGDDRRTEIAPNAAELETEDLIPEEDIIITITRQNYIKRLPLTDYRSQRRGGRGITAWSARADDFVEHLFITNTHAHVLFFTNRGLVYRLKGYQLPPLGRQARGTSLMSLIQVEPGESIQAVLAVDDWDEEQYVVMATKNGIVKKTALSDFDSPRTGLIAINLDEGDEMVGAKLTDGRRDLLLATRFGQAIRFAEEDVRAMGRTARGVKGITLDGDDEVVGMEVVREGADLLVVTTNGFGKRTLLEEYRRIGRGGKGVKTLQRTEKTGFVAGIKVVDEDDEVVLITEAGVMIRINVDDISRQGRSTQGVTLMRLDEDDRVIALALARMEDVDDESEGK